MTKVASDPVQIPKAFDEFSNGQMLIAPGSRNSEAIVAAMVRSDFAMWFNCICRPDATDSGAKTYNQMYQTMMDQTEEIKLLIKINIHTVSGLHDPGL